MFKLEVARTARHRAHYPPEMIIEVHPWPAAKIRIHIMYESEAARQAFNPITKGRSLELHHENNEPVVLVIASHPAREDWRQATEGLEDFFFEAAQPLLRIIKQVAGKNERLIHNSPYRLRFVDAADFYRLLIRQQRLIATETNSTFDLRTFFGPWTDRWQKTEGDMDVPGQRTWYAAHGPTQADETYADYNAEVAAFEALIAENIAALRKLQTEILPTKTS